MTRTPDPALRRAQAAARLIREKREALEAWRRENQGRAKR